MFNFEMDLSSYFTCLHVLELLLFIAVIITYGIYLNYMLVLFEIRIFNLFKYEGSMSFISLNLQRYMLSLSRYVVSPLQCGSFKWSISGNQISKTGLFSNVS
jgi:hypothetical protein